MNQVVDEIEMGVKNIIRGEENVKNKGVKIQILKEMGEKNKVLGKNNMIKKIQGEGI